MADGRHVPLYYYYRYTTTTTIYYLADALDGQAGYNKIQITDDHLTP
jgi:hypothetical protein